MYKLYYTNDAKADFKKVKKSIYKNQIERLLQIIALNPYTNLPPYKKLKGLYNDAYSRRVNLQHRIFYQIDDQNKRIKILRMWGHYGDN